MKLKRVTVPATHCSPRYVYYRTADGRFEVSRHWQVGGYYWQVVTLDGSKPFRACLFGKVSYLSVFNGETLGECREALADVYGEGED